MVRILPLATIGHLRVWTLATDDVAHGEPGNFRVKHRALDLNPDI